MISSPTKLVRQGKEASPPAKRVIDRSKPKVRLDGTPSPDCIPCQKRKR